MQVVAILSRTRSFHCKCFSTIIWSPTCFHQANSDIVSYYFSLLHSSRSTGHLRHLHGRLLRTGLYSNVVLSSKLVMMYSKHNDLFSQSLSVFLHMPERNIYSWNIIIGEFSRSQFPKKSVELFHQMRDSDVQPDVFTFPLVLRACAVSGMSVEGTLVHGVCAKKGFGRNLFVVSALVFMYVTFGRIIEARRMFDEIPHRDSVLWTAMLAGYAQHEEPKLGLLVFREMVDARVELDWVVMVSLLSVCAKLGWVMHGKSVHGWCLRRCLGLGLSLGNALIDVYVKCATLSYAYRVFDEMPERDVISWSALILGFGMNGNVDVALELFDRMCREKVKPNDVTFLGVLSACAHAGLVERARSCFGMMKDYGVIPDLKHYACMVDCLGKAGLLEDAERFVIEMPLEPDGAVLGALVGGCRVHGNTEVGERIAKKLISLEPEKAGYYVLLANIYATSGRFDDAERVRDVMKQRNVSKEPGCSVMESNNCSTMPYNGEVSFGIEIE